MTINVYMVVLAALKHTNHYHFCALPLTRDQEKGFEVPLYFFSILKLVGIEVDVLYET
jgi:hypothetical protein